MRNPLRRQVRPVSPRSAGDPPRPLLTGTWPGRLIAAGLSLKLLTLLTGTSATALALVDHAGSAALILGAGHLAFGLFKLARRRLLWRVRRKLIISYLFVGVVPVLLVGTFFILVGLLLFFNVSSYLVQARLTDLEGQAQALARAAALELGGSGTDSPQAVLLRRYAVVQALFPEASMALVPTLGDPPCGLDDAGRAQEVAPSPQRPIFIGPWAHVEPPRSVPRWVSCAGFTGRLLYEPVAGRDARLLVRAVAFPGQTPPAWAVVLDLPVNAALVERLRADTGIEVGGVSLVTAGTADPAQPLPGRVGIPETAGTAALPGSGAAPGEARGTLFATVAILDFTDWTRGREGQIALSMGVNAADMYARLAAAQGRHSRFGRFLLLLLALVGGLFLVIEAVALATGLALARSITGSVHELFEGTERVRRGDFSHKIGVVARDQLGELADSFNSMTGSIQDLLREMENKRRLEEELRIARAIQMSLLPHGALSMPGLSVAAVCVPAREVGGDYYDFLPLDGQRVGVLIADVAGKGASAALYMAVLKGVVLGLSEAHRSPRQLMIHANRIVSASLDNRSFITMTYAVIDAAARTMTYARAGHTPLIRVPGGENGGRRAEVLTPSGMVLGLRVDGGERFERLLEEVTVPLSTGDLLVFFTDGISEAMNEQADCFGEHRLTRLIEEHGHLASEELRERILREIQAFVGGAAQHDDMTMILVKIEAAVASAAALAVNVDRPASVRTGV